MYKYRKLSEQISKKLREHAYSFEELTNIVGCGRITMERYVQSGIVKPLSSGGQSNSRYFAQSEVDRACFVYDTYKRWKAWRVPPFLLAGFYDFCKANRIRIDLDDIQARAEAYKNHW